MSSFVATSGSLHIVLQSSSSILMVLGCSFHAQMKSAHAVIPSWVDKPYSLHHLLIHLLVYSLIPLSTPHHADSPSPGPVLKDKASGGGSCYHGLAGGV